MLSLLTHTKFVLGQTRILPLRISQSKAFIGDTLSFDIHVTSGGSSETLSVRVPVTQLGHWSKSGVVAIKASYFSPDAVPIGFITLPPTNPIPPLKAPSPPILALRSYIYQCGDVTSHASSARTDGAGVDIFKLPFWAESLPRQQRSWVILPSGRTPWVCCPMPSWSLVWE